MPRRSQYGYYSRGYERTRDPLAEAIASTLEGFENARAAGEERAERRREQDRQDARDLEHQEDRRRGEEDRQWNRRRDEANRRFQLAQEGLMETENAPTAPVPGLVPSFHIPGQSIKKVMPSRRERESDLAATIKSRMDADEKRSRDEQERARLLAIARRLQLPNAESMDLPTLADAVSAAESQGKRTAEIQDFRTKEGIKASFDKTKTPEIDRPKYLTPAGMGARAAELTKPVKDFFGDAKPGLSAAAAADSARKESQTQGQAAYQAEITELNAQMSKARQLFGANPQALAEAQKEYEATIAAIKKKYGVSE